MILEAIKERQSVRNYLDKEIPEELLRQVLEAGRLAPSACNNQPWKFIVVKDKKLKFCRRSSSYYCRLCNRS